VLGLATSIGGLDAQLASAAGTALVDAVSAAAPGNSTLVQGTAESGAPLLLGVADCVLAISSREPRFVTTWPPPHLGMVLQSHCRYALPPSSGPTGWGRGLMLRCLQASACSQATADGSAGAAHGGPAEGIDKDEEASATEQRLLALVQAIRREARGTADLARLTAVASALCHAAARGAAVRSAALPPVLALLVSRYPKARCIAVINPFSCFTAHQAEVLKASSAL